MNTLRLQATSHDIEHAAALLQAGEVVAFPTETVYGLGAVLYQPTAIKKIYQAKGRPSDNPVIIHVRNLDEVWSLTGEVTSLQRTLIEKLAHAFWPGPLTLILPKRPSVPDEVTAGLPSMAIRIPQHPVAQALLLATKMPIVAPSANTSGRPSPTSAHHVLDDLDGRIAAVVDGGSTSLGIESTVLDITQSPAVILRPGSITRQAITQVIGQEVIEHVLVQPALLAGNVTSPGMKYRHYAPTAVVVVVEEWSSLPREMDPATTLILSNTHLSNLPPKVLQHGLSAASLFAEFRWADQQGIQHILIVTDPETKEQSGLMNRIWKAAAQSDQAPVVPPADSHQV